MSNELPTITNDSMDNTISTIQNVIKNLQNLNTNEELDNLEKNLCRLDENNFKTSQEMKITVFGEKIKNSHKAKIQDLKSVARVVDNNSTYLLNMQSETICELNNILNVLVSLDKKNNKNVVSNLLATLEISKQCYQNYLDIEKAIKNLNKIIEMQKETIIVLQKTKKQIDIVEHLNDIDEMWDSLKEHQNKFNSVYAHLQVKNDELKKINELVIYNIENVSERIEQTSNSLSSIDAKTESLEAENKALKGKLKLANLISGTALGISALGIVMEILHMLGVV